MSHSTWQNKHQYMIFLIEIIKPLIDQKRMKFNTFPASISSLWAAEADFTRADVAAAIDFAASRIISSKLRFSSGPSYKSRIMTLIENKSILVKIFFEENLKISKNKISLPKKLNLKIDTTTV